MVERSVNPKLSTNTVRIPTFCPHWNLPFNGNDWLCWLIRKSNIEFYWAGEFRHSRHHIKVCHVKLLTSHFVILSILKIILMPLMIMNLIMTCNAIKLQFCKDKYYFFKHFILFSFQTSHEALKRKSSLRKY